MWRAAPGARVASRGMRIGLALLIFLAIAAAARAQETRYSLAGGCYAIDGLEGASAVRMQPTTLGRYLLYLPDRTFLAASEGGGVAPAAEPSPAADWRVEEAAAGAFTLSPVSDEQRRVEVRFRPAEGCAEFPEAALDATGEPARGLPFKRVGGIVEGHMHWMTFEYFGRRFHCGRPWHPYGIEYALPDCSDIEGPEGTAAPLQNFLNFGNPAQPHDTRGYPQLTEWSSSNLTYEGTYWRWVQRSWLAGLRLMVMGVNENRVLCELQANRETNCNEMDTVRRGFKALRELQDYVDAQAGGPGKGFFQIVTDPFEAREVINSGRMAVVMEIEISEPFDCRGWEQPSCGVEQVDAQLDEMYALGVRSSLLLNKFDNPLTGVRFDGGPVGVVINAGNRQSAGTFWSAKTCTGRMRDNTIESGVPEGSAAMDGVLGALGVPSGAFPAYPPAPHCNTRGLTPLGRHVVRRMMDLGMIVNPDHMSQAAVDDTLTLLESRDYSGVISPHGWMDTGNWPRLWKLGGIAFPGHSSAKSYVEEWQQYRPRETPYLSGWGYGADLGGLSQQPRVEGDGEVPVEYPFKSFDGRVTFERQTTGERTFDYTKEGVAHYGLYADWLEDLRRRGGDALARDMWRGAEAYIQMWERAVGVPAPGCRSASGAIGRRGRGALRLGARWRALLSRAGQPQARGRAWSWCVRGKRNSRAADVAVLGRGGRVGLVASRARGRVAGGVAVGARAGALKAGARPVGGRRALKAATGVGAEARALAASRRGVFVRRAGRSSFVYAVRGGRVRAVGVATRALARRPAKLRAAVRRALRAKASNAPRRYRPSPAEVEAGGA